MAVCLASVFFGCECGSQSCSPAALLLTLWQLRALSAPD